MVQTTWSMHIESSTLATFKNQRRKLDIANFLRTDTCKNCHLCRVTIKNYSPKAKFMLLNSPWDEVEGIIQQY